MVSLWDKLPDGIYIDGKFYPVHTDFRRWIKIEMLMKKASKGEKNCIGKILSLCYINLPPNIEDAWEGVLAFLAAGKEEKESKERASAEIFSFDEDAFLLYAAFYAQYGINLTTCELHWFQFVALFCGLTEDNKLLKVMSYRAVNLSDIKDNAKKSFYREMKRIYALPDNRTEEEKSAYAAEQIAEAF